MKFEQLSGIQVLMGLANKKVVLFLRLTSNYLTDEQETTSIRFRS